MFITRLLTGAALAFGLVHLAAQNPRTAWDGVYTAEQAARGEPLYSQNCASCHGPNLTGGEMAPSLVGGDFGANWNDLSLGDLFERGRGSGI